MPNFVEVSYKDERRSKSLDPSLIDMAKKYYGSTSWKGDSDDRRRLEFLFPHYEHASRFTADVRAYLSHVAVDRLD
jgi:hypothetical protein